jgi:hypothetical protein
MMRSHYPSTSTYLKPIHHQAPYLGIGTRGKSKDFVENQASGPVLAQGVPSVARKLRIDTTVAARVPQKAVALRKVLQIASVTDCVRFRCDRGGPARPISTQVLAMPSSEFGAARRSCRFTQLRKAAYQCPGGVLTSRRSGAPNAAPLLKCAVNSRPHRLPGPITVSARHRQGRRPPERTTHYIQMLLRR